MGTNRFSLLVILAAFAVAACTPSRSLAPSAPGIAPAGAEGSSALSLRLKTFTAGKTPGFLAGALAWDIVAGPKQEMWFTDPATPAIGRIAADGRVKEFRHGLSSGNKPQSIILGPDGNLWFSDAGTGAIGRVTPAGGITEFTDAALHGTSAMGIAVGSDDAIWAMELVPGANGGYKRSILARVTTDGVISHVKLLPGFVADGSLAAGRDGALWFLGSYVNKIILVKRRADGSTSYTRHPGLVPGAEPCCPIVAPKHLIVAEDGSPWFTTLYFAPIKSKILPNSLATYVSGRFNFYNLADRELRYPVWPSAIATDGADLWVAGASVFMVKGALFLVRPNGEHETFPLNYTPIGVAWSSPSVWFTSQIDGLPSSIVAATLTSD
jgi:hypothetical protein